MAKSYRGIEVSWEMEYLWERPMTLARSEIRKDILERLCEKCGKQISEDVNFILSFYRGSFIVLHDECKDFIENPGGL